MYRLPPMTQAPLPRRLLAELLGSAFLAAIVIGSGIAAQRLSPADTGLELLENAAATAAGLYAIILMFGPVSGGHFNPVVSLADASFGGIRWRDALAYTPAQITGCTLGAIAANGMFAHAAVSISTKHRASPAHLLAEAIATAGLLLVIFALARTRRTSTAAAAVGAYIGAAYFFTSSTSFANPAISIGRMFSDTFAGIAPASVPGFVIAQLAGGAAAVLVVRVLYPDVTPSDAAEVVVPHAEDRTRLTAPLRHRLGADGEDPPRSGNALELMFLAVREGLAGANDEVAHGAADEHFPRLGEAANACGNVYREATDVVICQQFAFPRVKTGANLQAKCADSVADRDRAADRTAWAVEGGEHPVAERLNEPAPVSLHLFSHERVVLVEQHAPAAIAQFRRALGRAHDVGEENGGEHAIADDGSPCAGQELLDLIGGPAVGSDLNVAGIGDVSRGVA